MIGSPPARLRILVVDDEDANLLFLEKALSRKGHQVILAHTGEEALALYERTQPDLVLMDVMLPGWDGFETTRRIRAGGGQAGRWVPLIFLSAIGRTTDVVKGLAAGGDDYLVKPVDLALLESKIAAMQRIALLQRELEAKNNDLAQARTADERQKHTSVKIFNRLMRLDSPQRHVQFRVLPSDLFSGDLVSASEGPDGSIYMMLADAAGHGLDAAASVLPLVSKFYVLSERGHPLARIARDMNRQLHDFLPTPYFVAAVLVKADPARHVLEVLNAGMPTTLLISPSGDRLRQFHSNYMPFGLQLLEQEDYQPEFEHLEPGYQVVACSDGLTESGVEDGKPFGQEGLESAIRAAYAPDSRLSAILAAYDRHCAGRKARDDVSIAILTIPEQTLPVSGLGANEGSATPCFPSSFALTLGPTQLKDRDLLANVSYALSHTQLIPPALTGKVFYVLKELVANAIDYGLLSMESRSASCMNAAAWNQWRAERRARLAKLDSGSVVIRLDTLAADSEPSWRVEVTDTGRGFPPDIELPHDGGLRRISQFTAVPEFQVGRSSVVVHVKQ
ncbi:MAG TPA: SpoIIE family protein phosphatase [Rhodocyclaceae bacterium]|nr:SpoIIE family protein phosphatase [Rhodocyclaceae bacterium]